MKHRYTTQQLERIGAVYIILSVAILLALNFTTGFISVLLGISLYFQAFNFALIWHELERRRENSR